jgi:hypothetical protein
MAQLEEQDYSKMRMLAIWEAQEAMTSRVGEGDHPSTFLA